MIKEKENNLGCGLVFVNGLGIVSVFAYYHGTLFRPISILMVFGGAVVITMSVMFAVWLIAESTDLAIEKYRNLALAVVILVWIGLIVTLNFS